MSEWITVVPAYGRDYKSAKAVKADWDDNKDFQFMGLHRGGSYVNKQDAERLDLKVIIRYNNQTRTTVVLK